MTRFFGFNPWRRGDQTKAGAYEGTPIFGEPPTVLPPAEAAFDTVAFVDGVQRKDLSAFIAPTKNERVPVLFLSVAAGAAVTKPGRGSSYYAAQTVARHLVCDERLPDLILPAGSAMLDYQFTRTAEPGAQALREAVTRLRNGLELRVAQYLLEREPEALLIMDGPLPAGLAAHPRVIGWIKSTGRFPRPRSWLDTLAELTCGEHTSCFAPETGAATHEWFVAARDSLPQEHDAAHLVRLQAGDLKPARLERLQAWSSQWVPRYASRAFESGRAPQQPRAVEALEQELGRYLGHPHVIRQALLQEANALAGMVFHPVPDESTTAVSETSGASRP